MIRQSILMILLLSGLSACDNNDDDNPGQGASSDMASSSDMTSSSASSSSMPAMSQYEINIHNATNNQPLSPIAIVAHTSMHTPWQVGMPASSGLEWLAESGMATTWMDEISSALGDNLLWSDMGDGALMPGLSQSFNLTVESSEAPYITLASMLINTNDAFTGTQNMMINDLSMGETSTMYLPIYDAGTEANTETAGSIPGPAAGGEGYNAARDDTNFVSMHPGVVTADDGLSTSALDESHRFLSKSIMVSVTKVQ